MKIKEFLKDTLKGATIGASCLVPGISGGTIALTLGEYSKIIDSVSSFNSNFKKSLITLLPIVIGIVLGVLGLWIPLDYALTNFLFATICLFAGFILGGIPQIITPIKDKPLKIKYVLFFVLTFALIIALSILSVNFSLNTDSQFSTPYQVGLYFELVAVGIIAAIALIIPGISGSMILLILGFYNNILSLINNFRNNTFILETIGLLACMALGVLIGIIFVAKLIKILLKKFELEFTWGILGFILGSIFSIFYNTKLMNYFGSMKIVEGIIGFALLIFGLLFVASLNKFSKKQILNVNN